MIDDLLKKYNLKYEDLNEAERQTFNNMLKNLQQNVLTIDRLRDYLASMRASVENDLTKFDLGSKQDLFLKARLRNYMLLEAFLQTPEKAKAALETALAGIDR